MSPDNVLEYPEGKPPNVHLKPTLVNNFGPGSSSLGLEVRINAGLLHVSLIEKVGKGICLPCWLPRCQLVLHSEVNLRDPFHTGVEA